MALRDRRTNISFDLWCLVASGGVDICISSIGFQKNYIGWPQQPPTERVSDISKKFDFWWSIPQKGLVLSFWCHWWSNLLHIVSMVRQEVRSLRVSLLLNKIRFCLDQRSKQNSQTPVVSSTCSTWHPSSSATQFLVNSIKVCKIYNCK